MNLLVDVNIALDICTQRRPHAESSALALEWAKSNHVRLWLYCGSTQTLEYNLYKHLKQETQHTEEQPSSKAVLARARRLLTEFVKDKQWLAALPDEGPVFGSPDPEDEQLLRAMGRFPPGEIKLLTRDEWLLAEYAEKTLSPEAFLQWDNPGQRVDFIDLKAQQDTMRPQLERNIHRVLHHGKYIMGPEVGELEERLAAYTGSKHCISVSSGTDSLLIAMMALGIGRGDEVITTPFTFIATGEMIALLGARPVFVDIDPATYNIDPEQIEAAITPKTRAIMPVSLYGQCADFDAINALAEKHGLPVIEDGAQSFGATYKGRKSCALSTVGSTSFFPSKPLGGYGDGGALFTDDDHLAKTMREIRVHGQDRRYHHPVIGVNGRMDTLQAAIVLPKLEIFPEEVRLREQAGERYTELLAADGRGQTRMEEQDANIGVHPRTSVAQTPFIAPGCTHVYAQYTVRVQDREAVQARLQQAGIPTAVHYPVPLYRQPAFADLGYAPEAFPNAEQASEQVISLPMHPYITETEQQAVVNALRAG